MDTSSSLSKSQMIMVSQVICIFHIGQCHYAICLKEERVGGK